MKRKLPTTGLATVLILALMIVVLRPFISKSDCGSNCSCCGSGPYIGMNIAGVPVDCDGAPTIKLTPCELPAKAIGSAGYALYCGTNSFYGYVGQLQIKITDTNVKCPVIGKQIGHYDQSGNPEYLLLYEMQPPDNGDPVKAGSIDFSIKIDVPCPCGAYTVSAEATVVIEGAGSCSSGTCGGPGPSPGPSPGPPPNGITGWADNHSVDFYISLGQASPRESAGNLVISSDTFDTSLAQPSALSMYYVATNVDVVTNSVGTIVEVKVPEGLFMTNNVTSSGYNLDFYVNSDFNGTKAGDGLYHPNANATPYSSWAFSTVGGTNLTINESLGGTAREYQYNYTATSNKWDLIQPDGQVWSTWSYGDGLGTTNYYRQISAGGQVLSYKKNTTEYQSGMNRSVLVQSVQGTGLAQQTTTYTYYSSDPTNGTSTNLLMMVEYPDGNWTYYTYDDYARVLNEYSAYNNSPPPSASGPNPNGDDCKLTSYSNYDSNGDPFFNYAGSSVPGTTTVYLPVQQNGVWGWQQVSSMNHSVGVSGYKYDSVERFDYQGLSLNTVTYSYSYGQGEENWQSGLPVSVTGEDGLTVYYDYPDIYTTVVTDTRNSTYTTNVVDDWGSPLLHTVVDINTGDTLSRETYLYTNSSGAYLDPLHRSYYLVDDLAGKTNYYSYNCCNLDSHIDADGVDHQYEYNIMKRQIAETDYYGGSNGIKTTNILDALGRSLSTLKIGTNGVPITEEKAAYDTLGRITDQTNALNGVTQTRYGVVDNQLYVTNTYPNGGVKVEQYYRDGRLESVTGSAVHPVTYVYGLEQDGSGGPWREYTQEIKVTDTGGTNEWVKTYTDMLGRNYKTIYSASSEPYPYSESYYNDYGQLWKQVDPDGVTMLYTYNDRGERDYSIAAVDDSTKSTSDYWTLQYNLPSILSGSDHVTWTTNGVITDHGVTVNYSKTYIWDENDIDSSNLVSLSETSADGLQSWQVNFADSNTSVTNHTVSSYSGTGHSVITTAPDGSYRIDTYSYGRLISSTRYDSTGTNQLSSTTFAYDPYGRQYQTTDARNGTTTYGYNNADRVTTVTTPNPGNGGSPEITTSYYNSMLQVTNVLQPDGTTVNSKYLLTGELAQQSGSRTYPVAYSYDYAGRMKTMTNWSSFNGLTGPRVTTWNYDAYRGFLSSKASNDGHGPSYTYTPAGRIASRTWVRGITTSYYYDNAGSLTNTSYSDSTPAVTNGYDRLGRLSSVVRDGMTDTIAYGLAGNLLSESFSGGVLNGLSVTNGYDQFLRRTKLSALSGGTQFLSEDYGYDDASRLSTVDDGNGNSATYSYLANSRLVGQIVFTNGTSRSMTTTKQYDYLNRLTQMSSTPSGASSVPATFNYQYNAANQRTMDTLVDGSYWVYQYDSLGQVKSGKKYWPNGTLVAGQQFGYTFDDIGNRKQTTAGGDASGSSLRTANYSANDLNQITNRDYPGTNDIVGVALVTNSVTVNGQTTYRHGEYFWATVQTNNTVSPQWMGVTVASGGSTNTGNLYFPKTQEQFSYDADGNLTNDGRWSYIWDGENRLIQMTVNTNVGPQYQLNFVYDSKGRRIEKVVTLSSVPMSTNKFLYDGWNLVAELKPDDSPLRTYVWGTDMSGSPQGAGGVGGLLEVSYHGTATTNCFPAFDGNGNVMALIDANDGTTVANYEYGPFGETIRKTGSMAEANSFRFSTKHQDDESDLLYYGYRYYNPSTGTWPNRDPLNAASDTEGRYYLLKHYGFVEGLARSFAEAPPDLNDYLFTHNEPVKDFDVLGLIDISGSPCSSASSGPGQFNPYTGPGWHHPPGTIGNSLTLTICCPKCNPYLSIYGITATPTSPENTPAWPWPISHPARVFPRDWTTIPPITSSFSMSGTCYTIRINVPTQTATFDKSSIGNVRVTGLCCSMPSATIRSDPTPPPPPPYVPGPYPNPL